MVAHWCRDSVFTSKHRVKQVKHLELPIEPMVLLLWNAVNHLLKDIPQERKCNWPDQDDWWLKTRNSGLSFHVFLGFTSSVFCTLGDWLQILPTSIQYILYHLLQYNLKLPSNNSAKQVGTFNRAGRKISWVSLWPGQRALEHQSQDCQWCERIDH